MISRTALLIAFLLAVSTACYGQSIELAKNEPFTGEKIFCVEVTGASVKDGYPLTFILTLADKDVPLKYLFNGRLMKDFAAEREFKAQQIIPGAGKYWFTFMTTAKTTISKFEVQTHSATASSATLSRCK